MTKIGAEMGKDYSLREYAPDEDKKFFNQRGADVLLEGKKIGCIGVLHPEVLSAFQLKNPVSALELDFESVWAFFKKEK
jgi:phenylalanyl-tRNA synthetase beta chain